MIVYRIETESGSGPYFGTISSDINGGLEFHYNPGPTNDNVCKFDELETIYKNYVFGFRSKRQLHEWFQKPQREHIDKTANFRLAVYCVDKRWIKEGQVQLIFDRKKAILLRRVYANDEIYYQYGKVQFR